MTILRDDDSRPFVFASFFEEHVTLSGAESLYYCCFENCTLELTNPDVAPRTWACCFIDCKFMVDGQDVGPMWEGTRGGSDWKGRESSFAQPLSAVITSPPG